MWRLIAASLACSALELGLVVVGNQSVEMGIAIVFYAWRPIFLLWVAILVWSIALAVKLFTEKRWQIALLCPVVPILAFVVSVWAMPYVQLPQDYMHFRAMRASYNASVARLPNNGYRFEEFNWGGMIFPPRALFTTKLTRSACRTAVSRQIGKGACRSS